MTIEQMVNQFGLLIGVFMSIVGTLLYVLRGRTDAQNHVQKTESDVEKVHADALLMLAKNGEVSNQIQREQVSSTREAAAELRGILVMLETNTKATRDTAISIDEVTVHIPVIKSGIEEIKTQQTDLSGSFKGEFGAVAVALVGIGTQLTALTKEVKDKDIKISGHLINLIEAFRQAETRLLKMLEPYALAQADKLRTLTATATTTTIEEKQEITLEEKST